MFGRGRSPLSRSRFFFRHLTKFGSSHRPETKLFEFLSSIRISMTLDENRWTPPLSPRQTWEKEFLRSSIQQERNTHTQIHIHIHTKTHIKYVKAMCYLHININAPHIMRTLVWIEGPPGDSKACSGWEERCKYVWEISIIEMLPYIKKNIFLRKWRRDLLKWLKIEYRQNMKEANLV